MYSHDGDEFFDFLRDFFATEKRLFRHRGNDFFITRDAARDASAKVPLISKAQLQTRIAGGTDAPGRLNITKASRPAKTALWRSGEESLCDGGNNGHKNGDGQPDKAV